eukprot:scaffold4811_cov171-Cylindrotheca_fusiformis.AAC.6
MNRPCSLLSILFSWYLFQASAFQNPIPSQIAKSASLPICHRRHCGVRLFATKDVDDDDHSNQWEEPVESKEPRSNKNAIANFFSRPDVQEDIKTYMISLGVALLLRLTIIEPRFIPSLSMYPTFEVGDQLAVEKVTKRIKPYYRREVVVFNPPKSFRDILIDNYGQETAKAKEALIKRIIAIEGDEVEVKMGKLYINSEEQDESYTAEDAQYEFGPVTVPKGSVLVLGDNRNHSLDGHIWGFLPTKNIIGRAVFIYWPPWRLGNGGMY